MNNDPDRLNQNNDDVAAVPVAGTSQRRFNPLWLLWLLLIPLFLLPLFHHRDLAESTLVTPMPSATPLPSADTANMASTPQPLSPTPIANPAPDPFALNNSGPDAGKAVLNFDLNATTPSTASLGTLNTVVAYLQSTSAARISLAGYTDGSGSAEVNKQLTEQRLSAVKNAITSAGVDATRIDTADFGEAYPVTDDSSPQARELNRRVEITLAK